MKDKVGDAIILARKAQMIWETFTWVERAVFIRKIRDWLTEHAELMAATIAKDTGKSETDALSTEVIPAILACNWYGKHAAKVLRAEKTGTSSLLFLNKRTRIERVPLGVVGIISPWNYPLAIPFSEIVMGLMAGNAVLFKGAPETAAVTLHLEDMIRSACLPEGLFQVLDGDGPEVSAAFFRHRIDKLFFTGSVAVGKELSRQAAETLTPLSLELGGSDPMIVLDDADPERAANGAVWGAFQNAGQTCAGIERLYVHESLFAAFRELLIAKISALRHGRGPDVSSDIGAITTDRQFQRVSNLVEQALAEGAQITAQSVRVGTEAGRFYPATLLEGVHHGMQIMREEIFGPVLCLMSFRDDAEAIRLANDSQYALTASVWTKNPQRAQSMARRLVAGVCTVNDHLLTHGMPEVPWGGARFSGNGSRTHGKAGLESMTRTLAITRDLFPLRRNLFWFPHGPMTWKALQQVLAFLSAHSWSQQLKALLRLVPLFLKQCMGKI